MPTRRCRTASPGGTPATETSPPVGGTSPANTFSSVLLPQPEGPMMEVNEPFAISISMSLNTRTQPARVSKSTFRPRARICAARGRLPPGRARRMHSPACPWPASTRGHGRRESRPLLDARHPLPQMRQLGLGMGNFRQRRRGARQMSAREKASPATQGRPARCPSSSDSSADSSLAAASLSCSGGSLA